MLCRNCGHEFRAFIQECPECKATDPALDISYPGYELSLKPIQIAVGILGYEQTGNDPTCYFERENRIPFFIMLRASPPEFAERQIPYGGKISFWHDEQLSRKALKKPHDILNAAMQTMPGNAFVNTIFIEGEEQINFFSHYNMTSVFSIRDILQFLEMAISVTNDLIKDLGAYIER